MDEFADLEQELLGTKSSSAIIGKQDAKVAKKEYQDQGWWERGKLIRAAPDCAKFRWMGIFSLLAIIYILYLSQQISDKESKTTFIFCSGIIPFLLLQLSLPLGFGITGGYSDGGDGGSGGGG